MTGGLGEMATVSSRQEAQEKAKPFVFEPTAVIAKL
jgi:hypothetical protein